jgi:hypothetical protein
MRLIKPLEKNIKIIQYPKSYMDQIQKLGNSISICVSKFKRTHMKLKPRKSTHGYETSTKMVYPYFIIYKLLAIST